MALTIQTEKGIFDLPRDFSVEIENTSPIYTDKGSQTIASTLPATGHNLSMVDYIHRPDIRNAPKRDAAAVVTDGVYRRTGKLNITSVSTESGIVCNIGFDESLMYEAWKNVSLKELPGLPVIKYPEGVAALARHLEEVMRYQTPADYHVFRIQVASETLEETEYPEFINPIGSDGKTYALLKEARTERVVISGQAVDVRVPAGYGISPFLKVSRILEMIFSAYGFTLVENPFATDYQLSKMVVLNNVADTIVTGEIDYRNLMPDCTVNEFLDALFCRTGAKVYVNAGRKAVIRLLKDSIGATASADWTPLKASEPEISYTPAKQLKLSAGTSFKEAEPAADSFEKFLKPYGGIITEFTGDRDVPDELYITYQPSTGRYYKRDIVNKKKKWISSDFFPWDKATPGVEYLEITGKDECVPMAFKTGLLTPGYLAGAVNINTTLRGVAKEQGEKKQTPLAFCFAMGKTNQIIGAGALVEEYYFGSSLCRGPKGEYFQDPGGNVYRYSLVFRGEDGAFNRFFKEYDAVLRHADHVYAVQMNPDKAGLLKLDASRPVMLHGQRMMVESLKYALPLRKGRPCQVKLRSLKLLQPYDLDKEQELVPMTPQQATWKVFTYFDRDMELRVQELREQPGIIRVDVVAKEVLTRPEEGDFDMYPPPSLQDVADRRKIMYTYKGKLKYRPYPPGLTQEEVVNYRAGVIAVKI